MSPGVQVRCRETSRAMMQPNLAILKLAMLSVSQLNAQTTNDKTRQDEGRTKRGGQTFARRLVFVVACRCPTVVNHTGLALSLMPDVWASPSFSAIPVMTPVSSKSLLFFSNFTGIFHQCLCGVWNVDAAHQPLAMQTTTILIVHCLSNYIWELPMPVPPWPKHTFTTKAHAKIQVDWLVSFGWKFATTSCDTKWCASGKHWELAGHDLGSETQKSISHEANDSFHSP